MIDKYSTIPVLACIFALIVFPIITFFAAIVHPTLDARPEPRVFWPATAVISVVLAVQNRARFSKLTWPPHIICLLAYLAFAGASVLWAFSPQASFVRYTQQVMIVTSIVLPAMLAPLTVDMMRSLFLCFALSIILNLLYVLSGSVTIAQYGATAVDIGYQGYFLGKNYLGECAAVALLLALSEVRYRCCRSLHFAGLSERLQNRAWPRIHVAIPGLVHVDHQKDNAHISGNHSIDVPIELRHGVQRIQF
jgi:hypothetical protein